MRIDLVGNSKEIAEVLTKMDINRVSVVVQTTNNSFYHPPEKKEVKKHMSAATRRKLSETMKKRWVAKKK